MKHLLPVAIICLLLFGFAGAQSVPPTQTINVNQGIACNAIGGAGPVSLCKPATTYGCASSATGGQLLAIDGNRTSIQFQNTGIIPIVVVFGDTPNPAMNNGWVVQPGNSYLWSNMGQGNLPGRVATTTVSIISNGGSTCTVLFMN